MRGKITAATVMSFAPPPGRARDYIWDSSLPGFGVMATANGARAYVIQYRVAGRSRRLKIADTTKRNLDEARREARIMLGAAASGGDPAGDRAAEKAEAKSGRRHPFGATLKRFLHEHAEPHLRWSGELGRTLNVDVLPKWKDKAIGSITGDDVFDLVDAVKARAPVQANRVLTALRMLFGWCVDRRILKVSPAAGVKPPTPETSRDRVLSDDEIRAIWKALDAEPYPFGPCVRLLLLTVQRRDEVAGMRWSEIDLDTSTWVIPKERSKNGLSHEVQLSYQAVAILREIDRIEGRDLVFTTTGETQISGFSKLKVRLDAASQVTGWIFHDLRRTATTGMARLGIPPHVADKILNHRQGTINGVAGVYNRFQYQPERRAALQAWANFLSSLLTAAPTNVIKLTRAEG